MSCGTLASAFDCSRRVPASPRWRSLALALGIAATTAIFSVVYATLLAPLPYPDPDQLVMVWSKIQGNKNVSAAGDYLDWKQQSTVFQDLNAWTGRGVSLAMSASDRPEQVQARLTTPGFYAMTDGPLPPRARLPAGGGREGEGPGRHPDPPALARALRRRSRHHRPRDPDRRQAPHRRRGHGARTGPTRGRSACRCPWPSSPSRSITTSIGCS